MPYRPPQQERLSGRDKRMQRLMQLQQSDMQAQEADSVQQDRMLKQMFDMQRQPLELQGMQQQLSLQQQQQEQAAAMNPYQLARMRAENEALTAENAWREPNAQQRYAMGDAQITGQQAQNTGQGLQNAGAQNTLNWQPWMQQQAYDAGAQQYRTGEQALDQRRELFPEQLTAAQQA